MQYPKPEKKEGSITRVTNNIDTTYDVSPAAHSEQTELAQSYHFRMTRGWNVENFYQLRRQGKLIPHTPFYQFSQTGLAEGSHFSRQVISPATPDSWAEQRQDNYWKNNGPGFLKTDLFFGGDTGDGYFPAWYRDPLEVEAYAQGVRDEIDFFIQRAAAGIVSAGHDTLTFLAEIVKVKRMVRNRLERMLSARNPNSIDAMRRTKNQAGAWLEWRYGWRTLMYDIEDINEAVLEFDTRRKRYVQRSGQTTAWNDEDTWYEDPFSYGTWKHTETQEYTLSIRGSVVSDIKPAQFSMNPITTAWELLPYSFVVDWVIGIGQALDTLSFIALNQEYVSSGGYKLQEKYIHKTEIVNWSNPNITGLSENTTTVDSELNIRWPRPVTTVPQIRVNLDPFKIIDLVYLVFQRLR